MVEELDVREEVLVEVAPRSSMAKRPLERRTHPGRGRRHIRAQRPGREPLSSARARFMRVKVRLRGGRRYRRQADDRAGLVRSCDLAFVRACECD